jgi:HEPN domain-containing protein
MANEGVTSRGFHKHAEVFSDAAEVVDRSEIDDPLPIYFLWGRAIELVLKSYLMAEGVSVIDLKKNFGHNLESLFCEAQKRGISDLIGRDQKYVAIVRLLNHDYNSKRFEYRETGGTYYLTDKNLTRQLIKRLLKGVEYHLRQKGP